MLSLVLAAIIAPPAGHYFYVERVDGRVRDVSAVLVTRTGSSIELDEDMKPKNESPEVAYVETKSTYDPATLDLMKYHATVAIGCSALDYTIDADGQSVRAGTKWLAFPGVTHYIADEDQALPFLLPAQIQAWHNVRAAIVVAARQNGYVVVRDPLTETPARPASIPAGDRYVAMRAPGREPIAMWYDPTTLVVDRFLLGKSTWQRVTPRVSDLL